MTPERLRQIYDVMMQLPAYIKQLQHVEEKLNDIYHELQKEYNTHPLACPFCKEEPRVRNTETAYFPFRCYCSNSDCTNKLVFSGTTAEEAIGRWNFMVVNMPDREKEDEANTGHED